MSLASEITSLLTQLDRDFYPAVSSRVVIPVYAEKLARDAMIFSVHDKGRMVAFIAVYCNDMDSRSAFTPMVAVAGEYRSNGVASSLIETAVRYVRKRGFKSFKLDVHNTNMKAIAMYQRLGFGVIGEKGDSLVMEKIIA
ncbi:MAG TPA: GNAT family N-acetyltransferase [Noviherbaspirillum sp.]|nr:GNAT family N-acetyltransferase [Noviherbaspirillum sp.]